LAWQISPEVQAREKALGDSSSGLDLKRRQVATGIYDDVHLVASRIAPKIQRRLLALVNKALVEFS